MEGNGEGHGAGGGGQRWERKEMGEENVKGLGTEQCQEGVWVQRSAREEKGDAEGSWEQMGVGWAGDSKFGVPFSEQPWVAR